MKTYRTSLPLAAALLALPAMAQDELAAKKKPMQFTIAKVDADLAVALFATKPLAVQVDAGLILYEASVQMLARQDDGSFAIAAELPSDLAKELYWQGITYSFEKGLQIHAIEKLESGLVEGEMPQPADGDVPETVDGEVLADTNPDEMTEADRWAGAAKALAPTTMARPPIKLEIERDAGQCVLLANFEAPSDGYELSRVAVRENGTTIDVYLYRKLPTAGESKLHSVAEHSVGTDLPNTKKVVRVWLAEGTRKQPADVTAWKLLATM